MLPRMNNQSKDEKQADEPAHEFPSMDELLDELAKSDLSTAAFARQHGLPPWKLYGALETRSGRRRKRSRKKKVAVLPVRVKDAPLRGAAPMELLLAGGHRLLVPTDFDEQALRRLMGVLAGC